MVRCLNQLGLAIFAHHMESPGRFLMSFWPLDSLGNISLLPWSYEFTKTVTETVTDLLKMGFFSQTPLYNKRLL